MNTPNKLTLLRIVLVPVFAVLLLVDSIPYHTLWALIVFVAASLTDMADGKIARKRGLVTNFGKFLDPLADKVLVLSALVCFVELGVTEAWVVIVILAREFLVTSLRLVAADGGQVIAASGWGKLKTAFTMLAITAILLLGALSDLMVFPIWFPVDWVARVLMWIAMLLTLISGVDYLWKNRGCIDSTK